MTTYITSAYRPPPTDLMTLSIGIAAAVCTYCAYRYIRDRNVTGKRLYALLGFPVMAFIICLGYFASEAYRVHRVLYADTSLEVTSMRFEPLYSQFFPHPVGFTLTAEMEGNFSRSSFFTHDINVQIKSMKSDEKHGNIILDSTSYLTKMRMT